MQMQMSKQKPDIWKKLKAIFFPVTKVPLSDYMPEHAFNPGLSFLIIANPENEDKRVINACSKNYHLLTNEELMTPLVKRLTKEYDLDVKVKQYNDSKFYVDFIIKDFPMELQKGDRIFPRIRMNNSYDGSVKYSFNFGFYRLICSNGLTAPVEGMTSQNVKFMHTPTPGGKALDSTMEAIEIFLTEAPKVLKGYQGLVDKKYNWEAALDKIEKVIENTKFPKKRAEEVQAQLKKEKDAGLPVSAFLVYNAFNHVIYKTESEMKEHKRDKLDLQILKFITDGKEK